MLPLTRRRALQAAALAAPYVLTRKAGAQPLRKVTLTLPWLADGSNAYAFVAKGKGYWSELGLDVEISRGYGSLAAAQAVSAGQFQFGLAAAPSAIQQAAKGTPLVAIACCGYDATMSLAVLEDSPVHKLTDLAGRQIGCTVNSGEYPFLPAFAKAGGLNLDTVKIVQVDPNVRQRVLMEHRVDAITGFAVSIAPLLVANGLKPRFTLFSSQGLTFYNNALITLPATLRANAKLCGAMVEGLARAMRFCLLQPADAMAVFIKQVPEIALAPTGAQQAQVGMGIFAATMIGAPAKQDGIGFAAPADYAAMTDLVMRYAAAPGDKAPDPASLFTNEFAGSLRLSPEEWAQAEAHVAPYRAMLG